MPRKQPQPGGRSNGERRAHERYPIRLDLEYRVRERKRVQIGRGHTVNLSSGGILFESEQSLQPGIPIELSITWPWWISDQVGLKLQVSGRTLRAQQNYIAVKAERHRFLADPRPGTDR